MAGLLPKPKKDDNLQDILSSKLNVNRHAEVARAGQENHEEHAHEGLQVESQGRTIRGVPKSGAPVFGGPTVRIQVYRESMLANTAKDRLRLQGLVVPH